MTEPIARPGPCPHCDDDHVKASCLAPFGVYGGCKSARVVWDAGHAVGLKTGMAGYERLCAEITRLKATRRKPGPPWVASQQTLHADLSSATIKLTDNILSDKTKP